VNPVIEAVGHVHISIIFGKGMLWADERGWYRACEVVVAGQIHFGNRSEMVLRGKSGPSCSFARSGQGFLDTVWSGKARVGKVLCLG
jgi:hypothetical protein